MNESEQAAVEAEFLSALEDRELRLLSWGYVDGSFSAEELERLADEFLLACNPPSDLAPEDLVEGMFERGLVIDAVDQGGGAARTRMAETVRLMARLRQLFPEKHDGARWTGARELVADYRVLCRPRFYPARDIGIADALEGLNVSGPRKAAMQALLRDRATDFRLSEFQVAASRSILDGLATGRTAGTIVGAGTGSGKTLAFYLPALSYLHEQASDEPNTRVLAIYPRIELLRDQFAETYREVRRLDDVGERGRPLRLGALYGQVPNSPQKVPDKWRRDGPGHLCPFMACPHCGEASLVWNQDDRAAGVSDLHCRRCSGVVPHGHIALTRKELREHPPDVLFTTTEMLNRTLSDGYMRHLVGVGPRAMPVDILLLDEVHTYDGSTGAHVAGLLRRWRRARARPVHIVGLSATLMEARAFFADLTGLTEHQVAAVEPSPADLHREGREYLLVARANPLSGASVLSTTIQSAMLLQRVLDPPNKAISGGRYGQKLFVFTDDLDVTNRLYFDLLDAEGMNSWGKPEKPSLSALRSARSGDLAARRRAGQSWEALERLGHRLDDEAHVRLGRTTSQDADVDRDATAIVATASLEVGFNDPHVGAILQHKSPHDAAAFLQRKGRAGRRREMRPWTVVVLSDYGRDRLTYQSYERLSDPELSPRALAIANPAILRMQAVFATLDWLARQRGVGGNLWMALQYPADPEDKRYYDSNRKAHEHVAAILEQVLDDSARRDQLTDYLATALKLSPSVIDDVCWQPPRALLTEAIPTAIRRLQTNWRAYPPEPGRDYVGDGPLPEFVVSRLFGDLALPEITVVTPQQQAGEDEYVAPMRAVQALSAYAPGRVSHRLTVANRHARHWIDPGPVEPGQTTELPLSAYCTEFEDLGAFGASIGKTTRVVRPHVLRPVVPPKDLLSSSNGRLRWSTETLQRENAAQRLNVPRGSSLRPLVEFLEFHTHGLSAPLEVRRWATETEVELRHTARNKDARGRVRFTDDAGHGVGIGFATDVDGLAVGVRVPASVTSGSGLPPSVIGGQRAGYFRHLVAVAESVSDQLSHFDAERLADAVLLAVVESGFQVGGPVPSLTSDPVLVQAVMDALARQGGGADPGPEDPAEDEPPLTRQDEARGVRVALQALEDPEILKALDAGIRALCGEPDESWGPWLAERLVTTVAAAVHRALQDLCPEYEADDLVVDLDPRDLDDNGLRRVWITEQTVGGGGLLQEALRRIGDSPRTFFDLIYAASDESPEELLDLELTRVVAASEDPQSDVAVAISAVREATGIDERTRALDAALSVLAQAGIFVCHPVVAGLSTRLLRPGSSESTDRVLRRLLADWDAAIERTGIDIDLRSFSELSAAEDRYDQLAGLNPPPGVPSARWRAGWIAGTLWPRGVAVRERTLRAPNPYAPRPACDAALLRSQLGPGPEEVATADIPYAVSEGGPLARDGVAEICGPTTGAQALREAILRAAITPVDAGSILQYPRLVGVRRTTDGHRARLVLGLVGA